MTGKKKKILVSLFVVLITMLVLLAACEAFLRVHYGLCDAVLMRADGDYEYIAQANQDRTRFGNNVKYNSFSMRSDEVKEDAVKILCVGDSIVNGGTLTDHKDLATTILSDRLTVSTGKTVQVLNVSAGSWGPDNCFAYLKKHGDFGACAIFLVTSSHDVFDTMTFVPVVGKTKYFPDKQYKSAIVELLDRYVFADSDLFSSKTKDEIDADFRQKHHITQNAGTFNNGFQNLYAYAKERNVPFVIYLHAEKPELEKGCYDGRGGLIKEFARKNGIKIICDLDNGLSDDWFRDPVHYSPNGQHRMADLLEPYMKDVLSSQKEKK